MGGGEQSSRTHHIDRRLIRKIVLNFSHVIIVQIGVLQRSKKLGELFIRVKKHHALQAGQKASLPRGPDIQSLPTFTFASLTESLTFRPENVHQRELFKIRLFSLADWRGYDGNIFHLLLFNSEFLQYSPRGQ